MDIASVTVGRLEVDQAEADALFNESVYECGTETVICAVPADPVRAGELVVVGVVLAGEPGGEAGSTYTYALVLDTDGEAANDFSFTPPFAWDFFQGTDRWYQLHRAGTWRLEASDWDARAARPRSAATAARVLLDGRTIVWVVPRAELGARPAWRVSAFRHDGSFQPEVSAGDVNGANPAQPPTPLG